jgi:2,3-dihydroxyphenylpropionate 1,2-dioxygenase
MTTATLVAMSHSPMMGRHDPDGQTVAEVRAHLTAAGKRAQDAPADVTVVFAPDHYNGFSYRVMPPFCIASKATSVGDFDTSPGEVLVRPDALGWAQAVMNEGLDVTFSAHLEVDHGLVQPLEILFGGLDRRAIIPVVINSIAGPFVPMHRVRRLGEAIGRVIHRQGLSALFIASGGLSHDPPVPTLETAAPRVAEALISGDRPTPDQRARLEARMVDAAAAQTAGHGDRAPLNPEWDALVMGTLAAADLRATDSWTPEWCVKHRGGSAHEIRSWVAAYGALATFGPYRSTGAFYRAIPEWIAGFGVATAQTA